jgi:hypothetical protein
MAVPERIATWTVSAMAMAVVREQSFVVMTAIQTKHKGTKAYERANIGNPFPGFKRAGITKLETLRLVDDWDKALGEFRKSEVVNSTPSSVDFPSLRRARDRQYYT